MFGLATQPTSPRMSEPAQAHDNPGVIALPPLIALVTLVVGARARPPRADRRRGRDAAAQRAVASCAVVLFALAGWIVSRAVPDVRARRHQHRRAQAVARARDRATSTRSTRNPMYQALGLVLLALAVGVASDWTVLLLVPWALVMHVGVVLREERYLEAEVRRRLPALQGRRAALRLAAVRRAAVNPGSNCRSSRAAGWSGPRAGWRRSAIRCCRVRTP